MELVGNRITKRKLGSDCLLENMELSDHMIGMSVRADRGLGDDAAPVAFEYRRLYNTISLMLGDMFALTTAFFVAGSLRYLLEGGPLFQWWIGLVLPIWMVSALSQKLYPGWGLGTVEELRRQTLTLFGVFVLSEVLLFWFQLGGESSRFSLVVAFAVSLFMVPAVRHIVKTLLIKSDQYGLPVVIYGAGKIGRDLAKHLEQEKGLGYKPIAFMDDHPAYWGAHLKGIPVLGDTNLVLPEAQVAILAMGDIEQDYRRQLLEGPLSHYRSVIIVPDLSELQSMWAGTVDMGNTLGLRIALNIAGPFSRFTKRAFDLAVAVLTSPIWLPAVGVLSFMVWLEDRHNPFIAEERIGKRGEKFKEWTFRTKVVEGEKVLQDALNSDPELTEEWEHHVKPGSDPRLTRVGRFLRRFSLDKIPQLANVLFGHMSLVGPRPLSNDNDRELTARIRTMREQVRPGMTGLWPVAGRVATDTDMLEHFDLYYLRNWSLWMDLVVIVRAFRAALFPDDAC